METLRDPGLERAYLSGIYHDGDVFEDTQPIIDENTFMDEINQIAYKGIKKLRTEIPDVRIDMASLYNSIRQLGFDQELADPDNKDYLNKLFTARVEPANVRRFAGTLRKFQIGRMLYDKLESAQQKVASIRGSERIDEILALAENEIFDFSSLLIEEQQPYVHISEGALDYYEHLISNPRDLLGISTGFPHYDVCLGGGQQRKNVNIIAARTGIGKSMLADNIALHIAGKLRLPVLYLDTEMSPESHWFRMWANIAQVEMDKIKTGKTGKNEWLDNKLRKAIKFVNEMPYFHSNVAGRPFEEMLAYARKWIKKEVGQENGRTRDCLLIYDYLKLMSADSLAGDLREWQVMGFQMTGLHNFTVKHDIPCLAFIQLNKDGITKEGLEGISQSDRISWLASSVAIYKPKDANELAKTAHEGNMKLVQVKSRHGMTHRPNEYINVKFIGATATIQEGKLSSEVQEKNDKEEPESE